MLASPSPRTGEQPYRAYDFPFFRLKSLPSPNLKKLPPLNVVLMARRSSRDFVTPLDDLQLSTLLWHASRRLQTNKEASGFDWEHRPSASAGGRHPIHLVIINSKSDGLIYRPDAHCFGCMPIERVACDKLARHAASVLDVKRATTIWFAAEWRRTASKYRNWESLVWRDSGALLTTLLLVAESLGLASCPLGISGEPHLSNALGSDSEVVGVGGVVVGCVKKVARVQ